MLRVREVVIIRLCSSNWIFLTQNSDVTDMHDCEFGMTWPMQFPGLKNSELSAPDDNAAN